MKESAFAPGLRAVRHSLAPLLVIQAAAVLLVTAYYLLPGFRTAADHLQRVKVEGGLVFSFLATALAGAVLPQAARLITRRPLSDRRDFSFQIVFFGLLGITVDLLYRYLAVIFGSAVSIETVIKKLIVDQFLYSPCISIPLSSAAFLWQSNHFSALDTRTEFREGKFKRRYVALLVTCWSFWLPVLACVYSLPSNLQFLLFLCANGSWSLLLVFISSEEGQPTRSITSAS